MLIPKLPALVRVNFSDPDVRKAKDPVPPTLNCILSDASDVKYTLLFVVALRSLIPTPAAALISKVFVGTELPIPTLPF